MNRNGNINSSYRRKIAHLSALGSTQLHLRRPWIVAWWSMAFPGTGHILLQKYMRGFLLCIWEVVVNTQAHINMAMVYSFNGQIERAKEVIDLRWMALYAPVYLFSIYDSYRTAVDLNKHALLALHEKQQPRSFYMNAFEINYLDKRKPWVASVWSAVAPGMGQLYINRIVNAFFALIIWMVVVYHSKFLMVIYYSLQLNFDEARKAADWGWLLFIPSIYFFTIYDAYVNAVEGNKLFDLEMKGYLKKAFNNVTALPLAGHRKTRDD